MSIWFGLLIVLLYTGNISCDDGVLDIDYPSLSIHAPDDGDIILQAGNGLKDVYLNPGPGGSVFFENDDILRVIEVVKSLPPVWTKHAHMSFFGTFTGEQRINIKLDVTDPEGTYLHFMIISGDLPNGITLNNVTGHITGVVPDVEEIFKFTVRAIDEHGKYADATFKMESIVKDHCQTNPCINDGTCIDTKGWFNCSCKPGYGGPRCELSCASQALGVSDKNKIPDAQMSGYLTYSSYLESDGRYGASGYGWVGSNSNSWLQVDLGNVSAVYAVRNRGYRQNLGWNQGYRSSFYTTAYTLSVSIDGVLFLPVNDTNGGIHTFSSSWSDNFYSLPAPVDARFVRFHPKSYYSKPQFKVELYGCHYQ
ncbi:lactadherin-like [Saccostrea cucullata]|uniref:lactadherin-like n=1 Tax=Saccostrea cuccullata TaxID=36930 RepID=UPI002ED47E47